MLPVLAVQNGDVVQIPGVPAWLNVILPVIVGVLAPLITYYVKKYLEVRIEESRSRLANEELSKQERLEERFKNFALMRADAFVQRDFFRISRQVLEDLENNRSLDDVKQRTHAELRDLGDRLKAEAREYFGAEDIDIFREIGERKIDGIVEWAANEVSPFPGIPTVEKLISGGAKDILEKGIERVKVQIFD